MCGSRGTRLDAGVEKPLLPVAGRPMVDRVRDALAESGVDRVHLVVSLYAPDTNEHLADSLGDGERLLDAPGEGYVADLRHSLDQVGTPALTVAADLPLLAGECVDTTLTAFAGDSLTVAVPAALKRDLGASLDASWTPDGDGADADGRELVPTGLNVVADDGEDTLVSEDRRLAVNVNRPGDAVVAEAWL
jgi:adenosylcobinamide-phosphate guanylyltransferase